MIPRSPLSPTGAADPETEDPAVTTVVTYLFVIAHQSSDTGRAKCTAQRLFMVNPVAIDPRGGFVYPGTYSFKITFFPVAFHI